MQNTIIKEFTGHPEVFAAAFEQGGSQGETRQWLEVFWSSHFLRDRLIWDPTGTTGLLAYGQPNTHLPFGRGFIIDQQGRVDLPYFGHHPQMVIARIYELLTTSAVSDPAGEPPAALPPLSISPNPFNPRCRVRYELPRPGPVAVEVFDLKGRLVRTLMRKFHEDAGLVAVTWDGTDNAGHGQPSGNYLVRVLADGTSLARPLTLLR